MYQGMLFALVIVLMSLLVLRTYGSWRDAGASQPPSKRRTRQSAAVEPWHSVSCVGNCPALNTYKGKRFLVASVPPLPVPGCKADHCDCRYVHYTDRRDDMDERRGLNGLRAELYTQSGKGDRRSRSGGRRSEDRLTFHWSHLVTAVNQYSL
ncbi:hypothetical protein A3709_10360 [Halioglobus sp. HI00S01]|uniref:hypothetical protein n=1 Tax=Halioglobus sp. HI00S01 TaxID=1822214 RepID=UPI0007C28785|nr:hypothetical protein [Halioglobus sp. HI00S01]KZX51224.1 hypothetical protein A3709_10360 [Halioglobus sp. HI00S01]